MSGTGSLVSRFCGEGVGRPRRTLPQARRMQPRRSLRRSETGSSQASELGAERLADLPVMAEGVDDTTDSPAVGLVFNGQDYCRTGSDSLSEDGVWVID